MKNNILQTFEDFLREPLSILKRTIITITGIESADGFKTIGVEKSKDGIQINVINSNKAYHLLTSVMYKKQIGELRHLINENKTREIQQKLTGPQISAKLQ